MKRSRFSETELVSALKQVEAGVLVAEVARKYGVSLKTIYAWRLGSKRPSNRQSFGPCGAWASRSSRGGSSLATILALGIAGSEQKGGGATTLYVVEDGIALPNPFPLCSCRDKARIEDLACVHMVDRIGPVFTLRDST